MEDLEHIYVLEDMTASQKLDYLSNHNVTDSALLNELIMYLDNDTLNDFLIRFIKLYDLYIYD